MVDFRKVMEDKAMARAPKKVDNVTKSNQQVAEVKEQAGAVPTFLQGKTRTDRIGNIDSTDLIIPRIKLLQGISPELEQFNTAKNGHFWHNLADMSLGEKVSMIPIIVRKSIVLWAPRGDERGILARSDNGVTWDKPGESFEVKLKGAGKQVWHTKGNVAESGLAGFGSSIAGDPSSQPAAALTYNTLVYLPDMPESPLAVFLNTRSSVKAAKLLISKIEMTNYDPYALRFDVTVRKDEGAEGPYNNYVYTRSGFANEEQYNYCAMKHKEFKGAAWKASDEGDEGQERGEQFGGTTPTGEEKF